MVLSPSTVISYRINFKLLIKTVQTLKCDLWRWKLTCAQISYFFSLGFFVIPWRWESKTPEISVSNFMMLDIELGNVMADGELLTKFLTSMGKKCYTAFTHSCSCLASPLAWTFVRLYLCAKELFSHAYEYSHVRTHNANRHSSCLTRVRKTAFSANATNGGANDATNGGEYVIGTLVICLAIRLATRANV